MRLLEKTGLNVLAVKVMCASMIRVRIAFLQVDNMIHRKKIDIYVKGFSSRPDHFMESR